MFTTLAAALILSCKPYQHPERPPVKVTCEGSDQVRRNHDGIEISRVLNACTTVRCEGADQVRRTYEGFQVSRALNACTVARCEGWDFVVRTHDGQPLSRVSSARRCVPPSAPPSPQPQNDALQYGLSYR
ncbi:MAG: hypothetical protein Q8N23_36010 [Archangium sp.]|nr:hypothetical protein [Archangium sp.]MDP3158133.1 hypothetical protein [Archangium sp.]MDP3570460.1 hypothetical protein [Archangium sp.]